MKEPLSVAVYSYKGPERVNSLLTSIRETCDYLIDVAVAQDYDGNPQMRERYSAVCRRHGAAHVPMAEHGHMGGSNAAAVNATLTPWVLVCSDDVLIPSGFLDSLTCFLESNFDWAQDISGGHRYPRGRRAESYEFAQHVAGIYLHTWDRNEIEAMGRKESSPFVPELVGFKAETMFWAPEAKADLGEWWWNRIGCRLPEPGWSERTPAGTIACCSNVHGSAYVINRRYWDLVGGTADVQCWQNDSTISLKVGLLTDGVFIRVPGLPSLAHFGGAAPTPHDATGWHVQSVHNLVRHLGGDFDKEIAAELATDKPQAAFIRYETALKLRAASFQAIFSNQLSALIK